MPPPPKAGSTGRGSSWPVAVRASVLVTTVDPYPGLWDLVCLGVSWMGQWVEVGWVLIERRTLARLRKLPSMLLESGRDK